MTTLNDKELRVLDLVGRNSSISQRELARATGISLGLINILLKKFLNVGYVKVSRLNKKKLEYVLTPKGFLAVTRKTYQYATRTIQNYRQLQTQLTALLSELQQSGYRYFSIHGDGEIREMIEMILKNTFNDRWFLLGAEHRKEPHAVVLNVTGEPMAGDFRGSVVSVLERLG